MFFIAVSLVTMQMKCVLTGCSQFSLSLSYFVMYVGGIAESWQAVGDLNVGWSKLRLHLATRLFGLCARLRKQ